MRETVTICCSFIFNFKSILKKIENNIEDIMDIFCASLDNNCDSLQVNIYICWAFHLDEGWRLFYFALWLILVNEEHVMSHSHVQVA